MNGVMNPTTNYSLAAKVFTKQKIKSIFFPKDLQKIGILYFPSNEQLKIKSLICPIIFDKNT